jgi:hypothetical protein
MSMVEEKKNKRGGGGKKRWNFFENLREGRASEK